MKIASLVIAALTILLAFDIASAEDWIIVPGVRVGSIGKNTAESELKRIYGEQHVVAGAIDDGEGSRIQGTTLFPENTEKSLFILWAEQTHEHVSEVHIGNKGTVWKTKNGITIDTPLKVIEQKNGRPVNIAGFGSDFGGTIYDGNGGALKELGAETDHGLQGRTLILRVSPSTEARNLPEYDSVIGGDWKSDHPTIQKLNPTVREIIVSFD